jgi:hypothetical protein
MRATRVTSDNLKRISNKKRFLTRWPLGCLLFLLVACNNKGPMPPGLNTSGNFQQRMDSARPLIKSGDIILRNGTDEVSATARTFNRVDTSFSHCGIVLLENDTLFVYHALGGDYNPSQQLRRDPIDSFCLPPETDRFAIYRYELEPQQYDSLNSIVHRYYTAGLPFDLYFNFLTDDRMYCSEFVFKCLDKSLSGALGQTIKARKWPYGISPDDLYLNNRCRLIKRIDYPVWGSNSQP